MNRERAVEKDLSAPATTDIINDKAVTPESSNRYKYFLFFSSCSVI